MVGKIESFEDKLILSPSLKQSLKEIEFISLYPIQEKQIKKMRIGKDF